MSLLVQDATRTRRFDGEEGRVRNLRLMRLYIVVVCAALALSQIVVQSFSLWKDYHRTLSDAGKAQQDLTLILEQYVQRAFESADVVADDVIERVKATSLDAVAADSVLRERLSRITHGTPADDFMIVDEAGRLRMTTLDVAPSGIVFADRAWFRAHSELGFERHVGPSLVGRLSSDVLFTYTRRLVDAQERFVGVFQIAYKTDFLESLSRGADVGGSIAFALWTIEGDLITRTGLSKEDATRGLSDPQLQALASRERVGVFTRPGLGGAQRVLAFRAMEGWPVVVSASRALDEVLEPWWAEANRAVTRSLGFTLLAGVVAMAGLAAARRVERSQTDLSLALEEREKLVDELSDLSLLRKREEQLTAARAQLRSVIDNMNEALIVFGPDDRLVLWNLRMLDFYPDLAPILRVGMDRQEYLERSAHILRLNFGEDVDRTQWARVQIEAFSASPYFEQKLADGRWVLLRHARGSDGSLIIVRTDITELKRRENDLRSSQEALEMQSCMLGEYAKTAEKASRAKSAFLAAMSHEIRTPLTAVIGYANLLSSTSLNEEQAQYLAVLKSSGRHLLALVGDILDFSRLESGALTLANEPMNLRAMMQEVEQITRGLLEDKDVTLHVSIDPDTPGWIMGDGARVKQILLNFTSNAVRFTKRGEINIELRREGDQIAFSVRDTGVGVAASDRERIFSAFEQVGRGSFYRAGAGLGLSISRALAHAMGGSIGVESEVGQGSCFWFRMPAEIARAPQEMEAAPAHTGGRSLRILVAEDAPSSARLIGAMLDRLGHHATLAANGAEAVRAARAQSFDLVLMDLQMPVMDGLQATREIRALGGDWARVPIYALTAAASQEDQAAALAAGMDDFLTKPFMPEDLEAALARAAGGGRRAVA